MTVGYPAEKAEGKRVRMRGDLMEEKKRNSPSASLYKRKTNPFGSSPDRGKRRKLLPGNISLQKKRSKTKKG